MRASVESTDPGHNPAYFGAKVFLDGVEISRVITADEEKGFVLAYRADEKGDVILETEFRYGAVQIDLPAKPVPPPSRIELTGVFGSLWFQSEAEYKQWCNEPAWRRFLGLTAYGRRMRGGRP